uniref:Uncharacterized protein n=1 Tax=Photinus pyralis TaxID=7054 RepID=A0A1Y1LSS7_PHOPY
MGNNGSRTGHISHQLEAETTWTQSFPRSTHGVYHQHKVLPEKGITKKLRSTNNGEILHAGGTISGRQHHQKTLSLERENKSFKIFRTSSVSSNPSDDPREYGERPYPRYVSHYGGVNRYAAQRLENRNLYREQMKKYGSEPDLRNSPSDRNESGRYKGKKKYKAPAPPNHGPVSIEPHYTSVNNMGHAAYWVFLYFPARNTNINRTPPILLIREIIYYLHHTSLLKMSYEFVLPGFNLKDTRPIVYHFLSVQKQWKTLPRTHVD